LFTNKVVRALIGESLTPAWQCYRYLHRLERLRQAREKDGNSRHSTDRKATSSNRDHSLSSLFASTSHHIQPFITTRASFCNFLYSFL